jgi:hypothetical protein
MKAVQFILGFILLIAGIFLLVLPAADRNLQTGESGVPGIVIGAFFGAGIWILGMLAAGDTYEGVYKPGSVFAPVLPIVGLLSLGALVFVFGPQR